MLYTASATHLMGGEMTVKDIGGGQYVLHLTTYRDTLGIPAAGTQFYQVYDSNGISIYSGTAIMDSVVSGQLLAGYPYGVEQYHYIDTLPLTIPDTYDIYWSTCCRNAAILNLANPLSESMWLNTQITVFNGASNSSPNFLALPVIYLPQNFPWQYNPMPFDADGDSLVWSIDIPYTSQGVPCTGYVAPSANSGGAFSIDAVTGMISWNADMLGNFVASVLVEEYRNGVKIGEIRRDMQHIVVPSTQSSMPVFTNISGIPLDLSGYPHFTIPTGQAFNFSFLGSDADENDELFMYAMGAMFEMQVSPATFSTHHPGGQLNEISGDFAWTPDISALPGSPYLLNLRILDGQFGYDETVIINLDNSVGFDDAFSTEGMGHIYPNPTTGFVSVPLSLEAAANTQLIVRDLQGREVQSFSKQLNAGEHLLTLDLDVPAGTYFLQWVSNDVNVATQPLIIAR